MQSSNPRMGEREETLLSSATDESTSAAFERSEKHYAKQAPRKKRYSFMNLSYNQTLWLDQNGGRTENDVHEEYDEYDRVRYFVLMYDPKTLGKMAKTYLPAS